MNVKLKEKLNNLVKEKRLTPQELKELAVASRDPWEEARGMLKGKKIPPVKYQKNIRQQWERKP